MVKLTKFSFIAFLLLSSVATIAKADFCPTDKTTIKARARQYALNGKSSIKTISMICGINENSEIALIGRKANAQCGFVTAAEQIQILKKQIAAIQGKFLSPFFARRKHQLILDKTNLVQRVQATRLTCQQFQFPSIPLSIQPAAIEATAGSLEQLNLFSLNSGVPQDAVFSKISGPSFATINSGIVSVNASEADVGQHTLSYQAVLGKRTSNIATITIDVISGEIPPDETPADPNSLEPFHNDITRAEARILFRKIGFGASKAEIDSAVRNGLSATVDTLVERCRPSNPQFKTVNELAKQNQEASKEFICQKNSAGEKECSTTEKKSSLTSERNYLFTHFRYGSPVCSAMFMILHNRFAVNQTRNLDHPNFVKLAEAYRELIMNNTVGRFDHLVSSMHSDGSMVDWLDNDQNAWDWSVQEDQDHTLNENYGREVMELFTLGVIDPVSGEPNYKEKNVREMAQAVSGFKFGQNKEIEFDTARWAGDNSRKFTLFSGTTNSVKGSFTAYIAESDSRAGELDAVTNLLLYTHTGTRNNLAITILGYFISPEVSKGLIAKTGNEIYNAHYDLSVILKKILKSQALFAKENQSSAVKSPVEYTLSVIRSLNIPFLANSSEASLTLASNIDDSLVNAGQAVLAPSSVFGWNIAGTWRNGRAHDGSDFLTAQSMVSEQNAVNMLVNKLGDIGSEQWGIILSQTRDGSNPSTVVEDVAAALGVTLSSDQVAELVNYLTRVRFEDRSEEMLGWRYEQTDYIALKLSGLIKILTNMEGAYIK